MPSVPRCSSRTRVSPRRTKRSSTARVAFARTDHSGISDWPARSSGTRCTPRPIASAGLSGRERLAVEQDRAARQRAQPEQRAQQLRLARADQPGQPEHLAAAQLEVERHAVGEHARALEPDHGRAALTPLHRLDVIGDLAEHRVHDLRRLERPRELGLQAPVAQHRDAIRQRLDLAQPVRDVEDRDPALAQPPHDPEQPLGLRGGQRRGRLVEHEQPRRARQRPRQRDQLALGHAQVRHVVGQRAARELQPQRLRHLRRPPDQRPRRHPAAVLTAREAVEQQVLGRRHPRDRPLGRVLVHGLDPRLPRLQRRRELDRRAVDPHGSRSPAPARPPAAC